ncbi:hypothetical protein ACFQ7F_13025 [Streptomyces sp. NPDC056486]|uniref:hypothetical protein n=1 Tax=Streptomyces sp. NPDC056486 TaxID=3345835 RepID=UPI0036CF278B
MGYTVKCNRTTNHIDGLEVRTQSSGEEKGGAVVRYSEKACGSLTRYSFVSGPEFDSLADALDDARKGTRKLCKTCEKAALAMLEDMAAAAETTEETNEGETVTAEVIVKRGEAVSVEIGTIHPMLAKAMEADPEAGPLHTVKVGFEGKAGHAKYEKADKTLCSITGDGVAFDHTAPTCKRCVTRLKKIIEGESVMPPKKKTAETKPAVETNAPDVDELISAVHATIDEIKAINPKEEGAHGKAVELSQEAETKIGQIPADKRTALRTTLREARDPITKPKAAKKAAAPTKKAASKEVAKKAAPRVEVAEDHNKIDGVPALVKAAADKVREGVSHGLKMATTSEAVARTVFEIRTKIKNPKTGLWDLQADGKTPKNAAGEAYALARKDVADDDVNAISTHNALVTSVGNRINDILVEWVAKFDEKDITATGHFYPEAEKAVRENRAAIAKAKEDETEPPAELTPSAAIRALYEKAETPLPLKGRTQIARETAQVKSLVSKRHELEALTEKLDGGELSDDEKAKVKADADKLKAKVDELEEKLPEDVLAEAEKEAPTKSRQEKAFERVDKSREILAAALKGGGKGTDDEKADLAAKLEALAGWLATEVATLKPKG